MKNFALFILLLSNFLSLKNRLKQIIIIASLKKYPHKKISYKNSKNIQYFIYEKHIIMFELMNDKMFLKYFVAAKRIKKIFYN